MNCMKCGRETTAENVFCQECLLEMEKYPVKPGTVVLLPRRRETAPPKKTSKRRVFPLEEQVKILKKRVTVLLVLLAVCVALVATMVYPSVQYYMEDHFKIGQNYTSVSSNTTPIESTSKTDP